MEIIEKVKNCKLVFEESEVNGCDCWGNTEWYSRQFVWVDGKKHQCFDDWYVIHDGKNVKEVLSEDGLRWRKEKEEQKKRTKEHFEKTGFETPREYAAYLKGRQEIENNSELLQEKIQELRNNKLKKLKDK
jgi:hypothetical protein